MAKKAKKDKQWSTKHYTENKTSSKQHESHYKPEG
jgi:hypothetical protein